MSGTYDIPDDEASFGDLRRDPTPSTGESTTPAQSAPQKSGGPPPAATAAPGPELPAPLGQQPGPGGSPEGTPAPLPSTERTPGSPPLGAAPPAGPSAGSSPAPPRPELGSTKRAFEPPARAQAAAGKNLSPRHQVESWLATMVECDASDLILRAGGRPSLRVDGGISVLPGRVPGPGPLLEVLQGVMGKERMGLWAETGSADAAIQLDGLGRFRLNAYKQMGEPAVVIRRIAEEAPSLTELDLPSDTLGELAMRKRGLVLVTGIAGSGKSTTLAAMIRHMNENIERHVITLEDPVELLHKERNCVISQREVGTDTPSFQDGLRHALRQSPDVILIGEIRDAETVVAALEATETGHLVISTMHTVNAAQTVDRIVGFFPAERHAQIRQRMADNLAGVLSQRLVVRKGGKGLVPAYELLTNTPHVRELLEEGKTTEMARVIDTGSEAGLVSFNECLRGRVERQEIELEDALATSDRPEELLLALRGIRGSSDRVQGPDGGQGAAPGGPAAGGAVPGAAPGVPGASGTQLNLSTSGSHERPSAAPQGGAPPAPGEGSQLRLSGKKDRRE